MIAQYIGYALVGDHAGAREGFTDALLAAVVLDSAGDAAALHFAKMVRQRRPSSRLIAVAGHEHTGDPREVVFDAHFAGRAAPSTWCS